MKQQQQRAPLDGIAPPDAARSREADRLIRSSVYAAMGLGLVPLRWFQFAALAPVQLHLARQLSALYGVAFREQTAKYIIASAAGAGASVVAAPFLAEAVMRIPLVGLPLDMAVHPATNALSTYAVGRMFATHFERGGGFVEANLDQMKRDFAAACQRPRAWLGNLVAGGAEAAAEGTASSK